VTQPWNEGPEHPEGGPVIRDRRRIDPTTGAVRAPGTTPGAPRAGASPSGGPSGEPDVGQGGGRDVEAGLAADVQAVQALGAELEDARASQSALLDDLQRLQAEYVNYRRRVDRDRTVARDTAIAGVLEALLPVLDDIGRARDHGDLDGAFRTVAENLEAVVARLGLERYGEPGEPFDPAVHEALLHSHDDAVTEPTCVQVLFPGYRFGDRILRAARVAVAEPS
jgi:molecular chaperone GrpE